MMKTSWLSATRATLKFIQNVETGGEDRETLGAGQIPKTMWLWERCRPLTRKNWKSNGELTRKSKKRGDTNGKRRNYARWSTGWRWS